MNFSHKNRLFNITSNREFEEIALETHQYQIKNNPIYSNFSSLILKDKKPKTINEIPFLPIDFFKSEKIISKNKKSQIIFQSSGSSGIRSKHYVADLNLYEKSFMKNFSKIYGDIKNTCIIGILPSYTENGDSSLIYMVNTLIMHSTNSYSGFYNNNFEKLSKVIKKQEINSNKIIIIGVTYALIDFAKDFSRPLKNTIIIETGGMKGKRKELLKEELHIILKKAFHLKNIHSEYGMTELLSQAYSKEKGIFSPPNWMKIIIRDINDPLTILGHNKAGGVNIIDLANIHSCSFIATLDLGIKLDNHRFKINGRFTNADLRGCNLLVE
ncbi:MAG: acyl transferase [Flavobacteriales bacterium]|jgi:hypothetical protein|nr:acyl transferase [Flavobacteriales bacterium]